MPNLMFKISYGLYVLCAKEKDKDNGCIINTLVQMTSQPNRIGFTVNKLNFTHDMIMREKKGAVSILSTETAFDTIRNFGMRSGRDNDKFIGVEFIESENKVKVPTANIIGYFGFSVIETIDVGTHTTFICDVTEEKYIEDKEPLTYAYYQSNIKPKPQMTGKSKWVCTICGYSTEEEIGDDFICPICNHSKQYFEKMSGNNEEKIQSIKNSYNGGTNMKKWVCTVCGYVHTGDQPPEFCPICKAPASKFKEINEEMAWVAEHEIGVAKGASEDIMKDLRANFNGECTEVGMYLAMSRAAVREGYPEVGAFYQQAAYEEAEHAAKFAELLGEVLTDSTKKNLELRIEAENGAMAGKFDLAKRAKEANLDAIHDTVHEMAKDEARHGKGFLGLYNRYFK